MSKAYAHYLLQQDASVQHGDKLIGLVAIVPKRFSSSKVVGM